MSLSVIAQSALDIPHLNLQYNIIPQVYHPFVQAADQVVEGSVAEINAAFQARRDGVEAEYYDTKSDDFDSYKSFNININDCWFSATATETDEHFARKAKKQADSDGKCGQCMFDRIMSVPLGSRRWEYGRLGKHQWAAYTGDDYYVEWAKRRIPDQSKSNEIGIWIASQAVESRGPEYTRIEYIGWNIPTLSNKDRFWAFQAYWYGGMKTEVYDAVMDADVAYRAMEFSRLAAFLFKVPKGTRKTHWGDKLWQILHDGREGKQAQAAYDRIQEKPLGARGHEAHNIFNEGKIFYICKDLLTDYDNYYDEDGKYYDPYYDVGEGSLDWLGEWYRTIDWRQWEAILGIICLYVLLMGAGFIFWPPFMLCLIFTGGDLNECSGGTWGNGYNQNKFSSYTQDDVKAKDTNDDSTLTDYADPNNSDFGK